MIVFCISSMFILSLFSGVFIWIIPSHPLPNSSIYLCSNVVSRVSFGNSFEQLSLGLSLSLRVASQRPCEKKKERKEHTQSEDAA